MCVVINWNKWRIWLTPRLNLLQQRPSSSSECQPISGEVFRGYCPNQFPCLTAPFSNSTREVRLNCYSVFSFCPEVNSADKMLSFFQWLLTRKTQHNPWPSPPKWMNEQMRALRFTDWMYSEQVNFLTGHSTENFIFLLSYNELRNGDREM